jgi:hypothetical protein
MQPVNQLECAVGTLLREFQIARARLAGLRMPLMSRTATQMPGKTRENTERNRKSVLIVDREGD